jgi:2Fe-2S ferredoxin
MNTLVRKIANPVSKYVRRFSAPKVDPSIPNTPTGTVKLRFFEEANNLHIEVDAPIGKSVLDVALDNNVDIEGACGGELACSTCHVIVPKEIYDKLPSKKVEEEDMLDLAWGVTDT